MAATDDLKAAQARLDKAVTDITAFVKAQAGVSAADAEAVVTDLNAQAANLESLIPQPPPAV